MTDAPGAVFLSYRRQDSAHAAARISDQLITRLGRQNVFIDVDTIRPGEDFVATLSRAVGSCRVLLALIGKNWTTMVDAHGRRRLDDPDDFVALEIATALEREIVVVPVLLDGAPMPTVAELPWNLKALARRQAHRIDHDTFKQGVAALLEEIDALVSRPPVRPPTSPQPGPTVLSTPVGRRRWARPLAGGTALVATVAAVALALQQGNDGAEAGAGATPTPGSVALQPVEDRGGTVRLTWTGPADLDYAVVVAPEGQASTTALAGRVSTATVAVDPTARFCVWVRATDGGAILSSNVQPVRGASCPSA